MRKGIRLLILVLFMFFCSGALAEITAYAAEYPVEEDGWYDTLEEVAVYLTQYDDLPDNFLTKKEAQKLGWVQSRGNLWEVAYGCSIGGDRFGNYEGLLPEKKGRSWTECDIGFEGSYRGAERIVFSNDDLIYYTGDHYETFEEIIVVEEEAQTGGESLFLFAIDALDFLFSGGNGGY